MSERRDQWSVFLSTPLEAIAADVMHGAWIGRRFGSYEIVEDLGVGGMGEVYRARDTRLSRDVAIKVLPASLATNRERLERFEVEARVLAALNDPHIAAICDVEDVEGTIVLILELVEGETLADKIARGPLPTSQAIAIAIQIAEGLEAAHDKSIIHRDLKPSNIALAKSGVVKLLDFGLATPSDAAAVPDSMSPDESTSRRQGFVGTAAYMSPEQVRGEGIDKRADVWAFGCVLYEMLTGRRAFDGRTVLNRIAATLEDEPDWSALPLSTPVPLCRLLRRCLEKDPRRRLHDIADARIELEDLPAAAASVEVKRGTSLSTFAVVGCIAALLGAVAGWSFSRRTLPQRSVTRFTFTPPSELPLLGDVRVAPDGSFFVYSSGGRLVTRRFDRMEAAPIAGTTNAYSPFVAPDSRWIGYVDNFTFKKVAVTGGPPITLFQMPGLPLGATWLDEQTLISATNNGTTGLVRVPLAGGEPIVLTTVDRARGERGHRLPFALPGGRAVLFTITADQSTNAQIAMLDLKSGQRTTLIRGGTDARYLPTGHLLFATAGGVSAVRFDAQRGAIIGDPVPVLDNVAIDVAGQANLSVTASGTLVYVAAPPSSSPGSTLVWVDREGHEQPLAAPPRAYVGPRLSPDGTRLAVEIRDQENDIWMWDFSGESLTRLTFDPAIDRDPVWTPDGRSIIFASSRSGAFDLYERAVDGTGTDVRLTESTNSEYAAAVTADGLFVIGYEVRPRTAFDVVRFGLLRNGAARAFIRSEPLIATASDDRNAEISPNGRYIAYQSNESGQFEIYVRPYPQVGDGRWQVSTGFGKGAAWARNGQELFYMDRTNHLMRVSVDTSGPTFRAGTPSMLLKTSFATPFAWRMYDVSADASRFLMIKGPFSRTDPTSTIVVVQNWFEELSRLLPSK